MFACSAWACRGGRARGGAAAGEQRDAARDHHERDQRDEHAKVESALWRIHDANLPASAGPCAAHREPRRVDKILCKPPPVTQLAGIPVSLPAVRAESSTPRGGGAGDPMQPRGCGGESPQVWRSVDAYASPTANPVGAKRNGERTPRMSGCPRDLAVLDHWDASLERSRARRARAVRGHRNAAFASQADLRRIAEPRAGSRCATSPTRSLGAVAGPLPRSPACRRAAVRARGSRAKRISLGALAALTVGPTASIAGGAGTSEASPSRTGDDDRTRHRR